MFMKRRVQIKYYQISTTINISNQHIIEIALVALSYLFYMFYIVTTNNYPLQKYKNALN